MATRSRKTASAARAGSFNSVSGTNFERKLHPPVSSQIEFPQFVSVVYSMKKSPSLTIIGLLVLSCGLASQARAQMKIGTIDMQKVFTAYYKTHDAEDTLHEAQRAYK